MAKIPPTPGLGVQAAFVALNAASGTVIATLRADYTYTLTDNAGGKVSIASNVLSLASTASATPTSYLCALEAVPAAGGRVLKWSIKVSVVPVLAALTLSTATLNINAAAGTVIGAIQNSASGSTLEVFPNDGRVAVSGANLVVGLTKASLGDFPITIRETFAGAPNSPRSTTLTLTGVLGTWATKANTLLAKQAAAQPIGQMTSPPTVSWGSAGAASTLNGAATSAPTYPVTLGSTAVFSATIPNSAVFTASIAATSGSTPPIMTVTAVTSGTLDLFKELSGATAGTVIEKQLTSTESGNALGGRGTYQVSLSQTLASTTLTQLGDVLSVASFTSGSGTLAQGVGMSGAGMASGTAILEQLTSTESGGALGGRGTYRVNVQHNITAAITVTAATPNPLFVDRGGARAAISQAQGSFLTGSRYNAIPQANNGHGWRVLLSGSSFDIECGGFSAGQGVRLMVNGKWADTTKAVLPAANNRYYLKYDFGVAGSYVCDVFFDKDVSYRGVNCNPGGTITAAPLPAGAVTVLYEGDSYTGGSIGGSGSTSTGSESGIQVIMGGVWCYQHAQFMNWDNPITLGNGGTGVEVNGTTRKGRARVTDIKRFPSVDVIVIALAINDYLARANGGDGATPVTTAMLQAGITDLIARNRAIKPNALILVVNSFSGTGDKVTSAYYAAIRAGVVAAQASDPGVIFADTEAAQTPSALAAHVGADATHLATAADHTWLGQTVVGPLTVAALQTLAASVN